MDITLAVPSIPPRAGLLRQAISSALGQKLPPVALSVALDTRHDGAWRTRQRALDAVRTAWVAFLDDDDVLLPHHLSTLAAAAEDTGADYVYAWYTVVDRHLNPTGFDPLPHFGKVFDPANPTQTTITTLVRTELAQAVGFDHPDGGVVDGQRHGEDYSFTCGVVKAGGKVVHVPERTWLWRHWGFGLPGQPGNTSGLPTRW